MNQFLTGAGHFGFGFLIGAGFMLISMALLRKNLFIQIYSPFLPFVCGFFSSLPYVFLFQKTCELPAWSNIFFCIPRYIVITL
ncbi:hypothetical protein AB835_10385 [Candidatus Endobugula sertula]|uniref:Uncharacterized protein n=1 Tax=Candidatus Endobugula sertula TaxID=62101 RepID=A0A1D2QNE9_9GAMM|nr:hypothetical protein AB835_10385 [Candidatus Endobugula sertula]